MKYIITLIMGFLPLPLLAQNSLAGIKRGSYFTNIYKISAKDAIDYYRWDSIPVARFENAPVLRTAKAGFEDEDTLPLGFYVFVTVEGSHVKAKIFNKTNLVVLTVNNRKRLQLDIRTMQGEPVTNASVFVGKKEAIYNTDSHTFWVKQIAFEENDVFVYSPGDTMITTVETLGDIYPGVREQKRRAFKSSKVYEIISWIPRKTKAIFSKKETNSRSRATGYVIFNKPKYKPLDTVKFKAYIIDKKWKRYNKAINVRLNYYAREKKEVVPLYTIKAVSPGAYTSSFVLGDSIPTDIRCWLEFTGNDGKVLVREVFSLEEYVLDEIGSQSFTADKETYYKADSMVFKASAKDANGLYVMDATARLVLTVNKIDTFFKDRLLVPDTLYNKEVKLETTSETRFVIPAGTMPAANIDINAKLVFKNSNNELQEKKLDIKYLFYSKMLLVKEQADSLLVSYLQDGYAQVAKGTMQMNEDPEVEVAYPMVIKINPRATDYTFDVESDSNYISTYHKIEGPYTVNFMRISKTDTLGFILNNPYKVPVYYSVLNGDKVVATGSSDNEEIVWKKVMGNKKQAYNVRWQYYWAGKEEHGLETIGLLYKILAIGINGKQKIFPGESDSLKIKITDYKGKPASNVNLTAVSYNNQFKKDIRMKEPPYLVKYKLKRGINRDGFENDDFKPFILNKKYALGKNKSWIKSFSLDSMEYYKLLFPADHYYDAMRYQANALYPQLAVHVVDNGDPQEINLLYINNELVYYNGVTDRMPYSFRVWPQNVKLGIRLKDRYIEIDSLYIQPNYKHDISFDINNLPPHSKEYKRDNWWSQNEMNAIEQSMFKIRIYNQNRSWVWQDGKLVSFPKGASGSRIAGPFSINQYLTYFKENEFNLSFAFEPGYEYNLSKQVLRLEKKAIFNDRLKKNYLTRSNFFDFVLGDTIRSLPVIEYPKPAVQKNPLLVSDNAFLFNRNYPVGDHGKILLDYHKDSVLKYIILTNQLRQAEPVVIPFAYRLVHNIEPGTYNILLVNNYDQVHTVFNAVIKANTTSCIKIPVLLNEKNNLVLKELQEKADSFYMPKKQETEEKYVELWQMAPLKQYDPNTKNGGLVEGQVRDVKGAAIPFASVVLKDGRGVQADVNGNYVIRVNEPEEIILFSALAYESIKIKVAVKNGTTKRVDVSLRLKENFIAEVVVTSAFNTRKSSRSMSTNIHVSAEELTTTTNLNNALAGKVSGVRVRGEASFFADSSVRLRGESTHTDNDVIYVVDGVIYNTVQKIEEEMIDDVKVLSGPEAAALFGPQAGNGAIVITTKRKTQRKDFRDYAFWEPNFFTDKNGEAAIKVTYPDNITSWRTFVVGMDKNNRIGKASAITQSYKPMVGQLNLPLFLVEGDSSKFVTKSINYTSDNYSIKTLFKINERISSEQQFDLKANDAIISEQPVTALGDTLTTSFSMSSTTGFKDMEERKIPVYKKGIEQAEGAFFVLRKDTTLHFSAKQENAELNIYAQNNTLDVLLAELDQLKKYPYFCVEQMTSKFRGLVMEKQIREVLNQPFRAQEMDALLKKIQKAQLFDGGWPWWEGGKENLQISNYITSALLPLRNDPLVESNVRNGLLYLQNKLPFLNKADMLATLKTLSDAKHEMNYAGWLSRIEFDSLSQHQQWQWVKIMQQQKLDYRKQLNYLLSKKTETMLGGTHWGESNYLWYANDIATTIIAMEVLKNEQGMEPVINSIIQYFLEMKRGGYWRNTVESATILNAVLPVLLNDQKNFTGNAKILVSGDTSFAITDFPYQAKLKTAGIKNIDIRKQGGGMVYFTAYQTWFNTNPQPDSNRFIIQTTFEKNGKEVREIQSGEKVKMIVKIKVLKDADYVMITMPIPAGCIFTDKGNNYWGSHKEYYKDRMIMYAERLDKGEYSFEASLEPRYNGVYHLNPAKATLMYYPVFSGNNEMKNVHIVSP